MLIQSNKSLNPAHTPRLLSKDMPITLEPNEMQSTINELFQKQPATPTDSTKHSIETILIAKFGVNSTVKVFEETPNIFVATIVDKSLFHNSDNEDNNNFMIYISTSDDFKNPRVEYVIKSTPEHHKPDIEQIKKYILLKNITSSGNAKMVTPQLIKEAIHKKYPETQGHIYITEDHSDKTHLIRVQLGNDIILFKLINGDQQQEVNNNEYSRLRAGNGLKGGVKGSKQETKLGKLVLVEKPSKDSMQSKPIEKLSPENEAAMRESVSQINSFDKNTSFKKFEQAIINFCNSIGVPQKGGGKGSHHHQWTIPIGGLMNIQPLETKFINIYQLTQVKDCIYKYKREYYNQHNTTIKKDQSKNKIPTYSIPLSYYKSNNQDIYITYEHASGNDEISPQLDATEQITQNIPLEGTIASAEVTEKIINHNKAIELNRIATNHLNGTGVAKNEEEAFKYYKMANETDPEDIDFNINLFYCYLKGIGVDMNEEQNLKAAYTLSSYACNIAPTNGRAKYNLGICFLRGISVAKDEKEAFHLLMEAYKLDPTNAYFMNTLAYCYEKGIGCEMDEKEAFRFSQMAHLAAPNNINFITNLFHYYLNGIGVDMNKKQNQKYAYTLCSDGYKLAPTNALINYNLAICYLYGIGVTKNEKEAFRLLKEAHNLDPKNIIVMNALAYCYENGIGCKMDKKEAFRFSQMAHLAAPKDINFINNLFPYYLNGIGVDMDEVQNQKEAYTLCCKACDIDPTNAKAKNNRAICYLNGIGVEKNETEAFKLLMEAHNLDPTNAKIISDVAYCYLNGIGVEKNETEAFKFSQMAHLAAPEDIDFINELSVHYLNGIGVDMDEVQNRKEAYTLCCAAYKIDPTNAMAKNNLAICFLYGIGTAKDEKKALKFFQAAIQADPENIEFMENLFNYYTIMKNALEAFNVLQMIKKAHPNNVANSCNLAHFYKNGIGVTKNEKKAADIYLEIISINPNNFNALIQVANCYENGIGVKKDKKQEVYYLNKAIELFEEAIYLYNGKPDENYKNYKNILSYPLLPNYLNKLMGTDADENNQLKYKLLLSHVTSSGSIAIGFNSFKFACFYSKLGNFTECKKWVEKAQSHKYTIQPDMLKTLLPDVPGIEVI